MFVCMYVVNYSEICMYYPNVHKQPNQQQMYVKFYF